MVRGGIWCMVDVVGTTLHNSTAPTMHNITIGSRFGSGFAFGLLLV
jgi:hypothetical protein